MRIAVSNTNQMNMNSNSTSHQQSFKAKLVGAEWNLGKAFERLTKGQAGFVQFKSTPKEPVNFPRRGVFYSDNGKKDSFKFAKVKFYPSELYPEIKIEKGKKVESYDKVALKIMEAVANVKPEFRALCEKARQGLGL